jgi:hypothetical protein
VLLRISYEEALHGTGDQSNPERRSQEFARKVFLGGLLSLFEEQILFGRLRPALVRGDMAGYFLNLTIPATLVLLGFRGFLLHDSVSFSGPSQLPEAMVGALLLALGSIVAYPQLRLAIRRMQARRAQNN